jgi:hypothetical protein
VPHQHRARRTHSRPPRAADADAPHEGAAHAVSAQDRREATDGPSEDDRFGEGPVASDLAGRILRVSVERLGARITISRGSQDGVHLGMEGYVRRGAAKLADFQVDRVDASGRSCSGVVAATPDQLQAHPDVVINPTETKATAKH